MARAGEPLEAQQREQRLAERRLPDPDPALDGVRHSEGAEGGFELGPLPLDTRADDEDLFGPGSVPDELEHLVGQQLERSARTRALQEADRPVERRAGGGPVGEQMPFEMSERRWRDLVVPWRELLDAPGSERAQVVGGMPQRLERRAIRLVRERDGDLGAAGERVQERPLRAGQVLEPIGEHRPCRPRLELAADELGPVPTQEIAVPQLEPLELGAVGRVEKREVAAQVAGVDETRLELGEDAAERICEA